MTSPADVVAEYLESVLKVGGSLPFALRVGKETEDVQGLMITIYDTGGRDPIRALDYGCKFTGRPSIQVRSRAQTYLSAYNTLKSVRGVLRQIQNFTFSGLTILEAEQISDIVALGEDQSNRSVFTINFNLKTKEV